MQRVYDKLPAFVKMIIDRNKSTNSVHMLNYLFISRDSRKRANFYIPQLEYLVTHDV